MRRADERPTQEEIARREVYLMRRSVPVSVLAEIRQAATRRDAADRLRQHLKGLPQK